MKKIIIYCNGGLANRFGSLVGGLWLCKLCNKEPIIIWPENDTTFCPIEELYNLDDCLLFSNKIIVNPKNSQYEEYVNNFHKDDRNIFITHLSWKSYGSLAIEVNHTYENYKNLINIGDDIGICYNNCVIPEFIGYNDRLEILKKLPINKNILDKVKEFCNSQNITKNVKGIHIRKTDFVGAVQTIDENKLFTIIKNNTNSKYFICSDSFDVENKFDTLDNVCRFIKTEYPEKIDKTKSTYIDNITRSKISVIQAFIDMLILSKTNMLTHTLVNHNISSFYQFAQLYNNIEI